MLDGDDEWADAVNWAVIATIQAEEFGITSDNVEEMQSSDNLDILRFLGQPIPDPEDEEADPAPFDPGLGLDPDFAVERHHPGRQLRRDLRAHGRPGHRRSASSGASTPSGPTAACCTPRPTADRPAAPA